mgnify:CR=1 FL=1
MSFDCTSLVTGLPITTTVISDCDATKPLLSMTVNEFANLANASSSSLTVAELFAVPLATDITNIFWLGFNSIIYFYIFAYLVGSVVNFISER